jgi:hypothetical protein
LRGAGFDLITNGGKGTEGVVESRGLRKVNRCLTEGRRAFLKRVAGIEAGAECERLAPLISKVADGEAGAEEMRLVRPHLKGCLACKATLREYRETPARVAGLVPPVVALAGGGGGASGFAGRVLERLAGMGDAAGAKVAAVAASVVVLAGGAAGVGALHHDPPAVAPSAFTSAAASSPATQPVSAPAAGAPASTAPGPSAAAIEAVAHPESPSAREPAELAHERSDPQPEFDPGTGVEPPSPTPSPAPAATPPSQAAPTSASSEFAP